jgi:hypothetical protein
VCYPSVPPASAQQGVGEVGHGVCRGEVSWTASEVD